MSEVAEAPVQVSAEQTQTETKVETPSPFAREAWVETIPEVKKETAEPTPTASSVAPEPKKDIPATDTEEILDPKDWLKREFEIDDPEVLRQQIKEYKEIKSKPQPEEQKWENEESKAINELLRTGKKKEVLQILALQDKLESLVASEVNDDNATEIIKTGLRLKHKDLTDKEIDYKYNKLYSLPKEPVQGTSELDEDFEERLNDWKERVEDIRVSRIIDAKTMKPDLEKAKVELKFPEIEKQPSVQANEPDPEVVKQIRDRFMNKLESDYVKAEGFSTQVKDESVDIPVSFKIPDESKIAIKKTLEDFDVNDYIGKRWFGENGEPKIEQMVSDLYLLDNTDKVLSGIANNSANQRIVELRKQANNIDLKNQPHQNTFQPNADGKSNISPFAKEAWSEKPPAFV